MIATLPQLHDNVEESDLLHLTDPINNIYVLQQDGSVPERERGREREEGRGKKREEWKLNYLLPYLPLPPSLSSLTVLFAFY